MLRQIKILALGLLLSGFASQCRGDLVIYFQDTTVPQGGRGVLNVWLASTTPAIDVFNNESFMLQITGPNFLEFAPNPSAPSSATPQTQSYAYLTSSNYIFSSDSLFGLTDSNAGALPLNQANQQFIGSDQSFSYTAYSPANNGPGVTLLGSIVLYAASTNVNEQYYVSLVSGPNTYFNQVDPNTGDVIPGSDLGYSVANTPGYTGTVTIGSVASVPEPSPIVSAFTSMVILAGARLVRARSKDNDPGSGRRGGL